MKIAAAGRFVSTLYCGWLMISAVGALGGHGRGFGFTAFLFPMGQDLGLNRQPTPPAISPARAMGISGAAAG